MEQENESYTSSNREKQFRYGMSFVCLIVFLLLFITVRVRAEEQIGDVSAGQQEDAMPQVADGIEENERNVYTDQQGIQYELYDGHTCYVTGYTNEIKSTIIIPVQIEDEGSTYRVTGIEESAFQKCSALKRIEIPDSVTDFHEGIFSSCKKLKEIDILPTKASIKKNGRTMVVSIKVNSALLGAAPSVKLEVGEEIIRKAAADKKTDTVTLLISNAATSGGKNLMPDGVLMQEEAVKAVATSGKDLKVRIKDTDGTSHSIKVDAVGLKQAEGELCLLLQEKKVSNTSGTFHSDVLKALEKNNIRSSAVKTLSFSYGSGEKPNVDLVVPVEGVGGSKAGDSMYIYRYDKNKRTFVALFYRPYTVSKDSSVTMSISRGGQFVVSKKPFQYMSRKPSNGFLTQAGNTYYLDKNGSPLCGWRKISGAYYYFDRESGKMAFAGKVDRIKIKDNGVAEVTAASEQRIQTMMKARAVVEQITNASDSKSQKIEKCFRWVFQFPYRRYRRLKPIYKQEGWEVTFANDIFDKHQGCCVSEASAVAFLFHECGYKTVYVACDTGHAWVELNGRIYDPLFAEARGFSQYYNVPYDGYGMWAVLKRKI